MNVSSTVATPVHGVSQLIPLTLIQESPTNPRTHFDVQKLKELTASIKQHGVLQPILLRPRGEGYELVAGHRRFRAAAAAGLSEIPATVRELDDKAALEIQLVENVAREDLHPMEEAEGYERLLRDYDYTADSLADKIGKSRAYVYARMKLTALCETVRSALWDGRISHSIALLIARIPVEKLQVAALRSVSQNGVDETMTYRQAYDHIQRQFMLLLKDAPFKRDDADLLPSAGPCKTCPMRTGNQKELFGDVKNTDVCTNPVCYQQKLDAYWARLQEHAREKGHRVLPEGEVEKVFGRYGHGIEYSAPYVVADNPIDFDSKKTFRKALGNKLPQITVARNPRDGRVYELIPRKAAHDALCAAGLKKASANDRHQDDYKKKQLEETAKRKLERAVESAIIAEIRPKLAKLQISTPLLRILGKALAISKKYAMEEVFKRRGLKWPSWQGQEKVIWKFVDGLGDAEIALLGAELALNFNNLEMRSADERDLVRQLARLVDVDDAAIGKRIRGEAAAKKRARAAKSKPAKKAAGGRRKKSKR